MTDPTDEEILTAVRAIEASGSPFRPATYDEVLRFAAVTLQVDLDRVRDVMRDHELGRGAG